MKIVDRAYRFFRTARTTNAYTGRFIFFLLRVGMLKTIIMFILVRKYRLPLSTYSVLARNLGVVQAVNFGQYLYKGIYSYEEMKVAVRAGDDDSSRQEREEFEDSLTNDS